jgi:hypothetical protein
VLHGKLNDTNTHVPDSYDESLFSLPSSSSSSDRTWCSKMSEILNKKYFKLMDQQNPYLKSQHISIHVYSALDKRNMKLDSAWEKDF